MSQNNLRGIKEVPKRQTGRAPNTDMQPVAGVRQSCQNPHTCEGGGSNLPLFAA